MLFRAIKNQHNKVFYKDFIDGALDASLQLPPQGKNFEYLFGYYTVFFKDYIAGELDASLKLRPQSKKLEYLFGYYSVSSPS